jgi:hypothetical protein
MKTTQVDLPALNWFIHVLKENVGHCQWVKMTKEELEKSKKQTGSDYPYKVIEHPIPPGKDIILEKGDHVIKCDSEWTRNLIVELARAYDRLEREHTHICREKCSEEWHKIEELPPHSKASSFHERGRIFLVWSPVLDYVKGSCFGCRDGDKWFIKVDGKDVEHPVTHYRHLPPKPMCDTVPYEQVKDEVERLRTEYEKN